MKAEKALELFESSPFIPVFYYKDKDTCLNVMKSCLEAGLKIIEFTDRGEGAEENFKALLDLRDKNYPDVIVGIGSLFNSEETKNYINIGADFIVSPILDEGMAKACQEKGMLWIPGIGTTTEAYRASQLGAELIKMFPGNVLGPGFAKSVLGPMPHLRLMPTGGVKPDEENLTEWYNSGVKTVGMGSQLLDKKFINSGDYAGLTESIKTAVSVAKKVKK